jgi:peptide/nickel transport system ATP-binding protein
MGFARRGCRIAAERLRIGDIDVLGLEERKLRALRGRTVTYIAQSAAASFNPSRKVIDQVVEPACLHGICGGTKPRRRRSRCSANWRCPSPSRLASVIHTRSPADSCSG